MKQSRNPNSVVIATANEARREAIQFPPEDLLIAIPGVILTSFFGVRICRILDILDSGTGAAAYSAWVLLWGDELLP